MKPITLTGEEVRGILAGTLTQLRRVVRPQPDDDVCGLPYWNVGGFRMWHGAANPLPRPFGERGDRLWGKERWAAVPRSSSTLYRADKMYDGMADGDFGFDWSHPSRMPRERSRITLEVLAVRAERDGAKWVWVVDFRRVEESK